MDSKWSEKNIEELQLFFSTDIEKGLTQEQYSQAKEQYGENIIDSEILEQQNFYGLQKKKRNLKAMLSGSVGITGVLYFLTVIILKIMGFDINIYIFPAFYIFLSVSVFIISSDSEKKYGQLYKSARPKALVIRENKRKKVYIENIVPGDVMLLSAGDIIPADARIVSAGYLSCIRVNKDGAYIRTEKNNIIYAADIVDSGNASAVVIATGNDTYISRVTRQDELSEYTPVHENNSGAQDGYSVMQKYAHKLSKDFFLVSMLLSMLIIFAGIIQERDFITLLMTCVTAAAASFSEQIPIIADFAVVHGMHRLCKSGILVKKTSTIDEINNIDTVIAKKNESFTQDNKMKLEKISDLKPAIENAPQIGYILTCMAMCSNVDVIRPGQNKVRYSGSATDVAVFEALNKCGLNYDAVNQFYQKVGKTIYNPENGIKSAIVMTEKSKSKLICFGEAFNILDRCYNINIKSYKDKLESLYNEYDLIMAAAIKDFSHKDIVSGGTRAEMESGLEFLGFASFSEPKTSAVFESIDYLKKSGVNPVMIADSDTVHSRSAAVKFGIIKNQSESDILNDEKINAMGDSLFFINADKFRLFTPVSLENRLKFLQALKFRKKSPAMTINDIEEISLLNEPCLTFTSVNTETGILKNKASVITKNLTVSTISKTIRSSVLIYRNICKIAHFSSMLFISQYLLIFFAVFLNGAYILNPVQIIWTGTGAGYIFTVSVCFSDDNKNWHVFRNSIQEYKEPKKFNKTILKYGLIYGLLIFIFSVLSFFICLIMQESVSAAAALKEYISSGVNINPAQTAAFITYIISCASFALNYIKGPRFRISKNKVFTVAFILNLAAVLCAVFVPAVRDFSGFGEIGVKIFGVSAAIGLCPFIISRFFRRKIFFA